MSIGKPQALTQGEGQGYRWIAICEAHMMSSWAWLFNEGLIDLMSLMGTNLWVEDVLLKQISLV